MINLPAINWDDKVLSKRQLNKTRYYIPCPGVQFRHGQNANKPQACKECGRFHPRCCRHKLSCHDNAIVYVDGACSKNGNNEARSGIGYALGIFKEQQFSLPVTKARDYDGPRTSQRAELLAAYHGLIGLRNDQRFNVRPERETGGAGEHGKEVWVVAMDSEYVVKGVAEYYPQWKKNHWRGSGGQTPKNLDLFQLLMEAVEFAEEDFDVRVKFWWIPRECNELADKLARAGARDAEPLPTPSSS